MAMSELDLFLKIKQIKAFILEDQDFANYLFNNLNRFSQNDMPDLILQNILSSKGSVGIEHTQVSIFKESRKGAKIKRSLRELKQEVIKVDLEYMELSLVDIQPHYKEKLRLDNGRTFIQNIVNAINSKSKKSKKYLKFDSNILWLDIEDFVTIHPTLVLNNQIKSALICSGFNSVLIGNSETLHYFNIRNLVKLNFPSNEKLLINTIQDLSQTYKALKSIHVKFNSTLGEAKISGNITENYISYVRFVFEGSVVFKPITRFFTNNIELPVKESKRVGDSRFVKIDMDGMILQFELMNNHINIRHTLKLNKGDKISSDIADKKSSLLQQCLTGVINIIVQEDDLIEHYKYVPSFDALRNMKFKEIDI